MDISKIQFGELSQAKGTDKSFEDLDVNNDGKISSADEASATSTDIKAVIQSLLNSQDEESSCTEFQEDEHFDVRKAGACSANNDAAKQILYSTLTPKSLMINTTNSRNAGEGLGISDILSAYDELVTLSGDLLVKAFKNFIGNIRTISKLLTKTANSLNATNEEISRLKEIMCEISSGTGTLVDKLKEANYMNYQKRTDESKDKWIKMLSTNQFHGLSELNNIITKAENDNSAVSQISSKLVNGDIPEGESITVNLSDIADEKALSLKLNSFTIKKVNGKYVYSFDNRWSVTHGVKTQAGGGSVNITDAQIDAVIQAIGTNWGNMYSQNGISTNSMAQYKILEVLGAKVDSVGNGTFTNEFCETSMITDCLNCGGGATGYVAIFILVEKIRDLFDAAKNQATNSAEN